MKQLTKEFWDDMYRQFPEGMKIFNEWIDVYKQIVKWQHLFNVGLGVALIPKYHELPHAMQVGIWLQFESEIATRSNSPFYYFKAAECIKSFIKNLHEEATD